jgi:hypothetical protein
MRLRSELKAAVVWCERSQTVCRGCRAIAISIIGMPWSVAATLDEVATNSSSDS